jgi:hypothetical protein
VVVGLKRFAIATEKAFGVFRVFRGQSSPHSDAFTGNLRGHRGKIHALTIGTPAKT